MKKIAFAILCAIAALASCTKTPVEELGQEIKVDLTINRTDAFDGTKATVKTAWANDDVIFLFFKNVGVADAKYMELKYNSGTDSWTATAKNGLVASDLTGAAEKTMTAVYLPYGSDATVAYDGVGAFVFKDGGDPLNYKGYFLQDAGVAYTYDTELHGELNLTAPALSVAGDVLVHFDLTVPDNANKYALYQEYVKPLSVAGVAADGTVNKTEGPIGRSLTGYIHSGSLMSFSGILDKGAVGAAKTYEFSLWDDTASTLYITDKDSRTIAGTDFIGLGTVAGDWTAYTVGTHFVYLGIDNASGQRIMWATRNLGATEISGVGSYGDYYAWGDLTGYALDGEFGSYTSLHNFNTNPVYSVDANHNLLPQYDAAHVAMKGLWRMPTKEEFDALCDDNNTKGPGGGGDRSFQSYPYVTSGSTFISKVSLISIFFPAASFVNGNTPGSQGYYAFYWSSTEESSNRGYLLYANYNGGVGTSADASNVGLPIRPVFSVDY